MEINSTLIKNIAIGALSVFTVFSIVRFDTYNSMLESSEAVSSYLQKENTTIKNRIDSLQNEYDKKEVDYKKLYSIFENKNKEYNKLKLENNYLQSKLANVENDLANISSDSSYSYLMHRYIPLQDSLYYKFAPNQMTSIHGDILRFDYQAKIITNYNETSNTLFELYTNSNLMYNNCDQQKYILLEQNGLLNKNINNLQAINDTYTKKIKQQKLKTSLFGIGAVGILTYIVVKSVINN